MEIIRTLYTKKDWAWTQWTTIKINDVAGEILAYKKKKYAEIKKISVNQRTFANTIFAIENCHGEIAPRINSLEFLMNIGPNRAVREAANKAMDKISKALVDIEYDEGIYRAVKEYEAKKEKLTGEDQKLFKDMRRDYGRMGFELDPKSRGRLKKNLKKLSQLETAFAKNINEYRDYIRVAPAELAGLPDNYINRLRKDSRGYYLVSLEYPEFFPFMENASNARKRKELAHKHHLKGGKKNLTIIKKVIGLRGENAKLLGYKSHADFRTEIRMAKSSIAALGFINNLMAKLKPLLKKELVEMAALKKKETGNGKLEYYDILYYENKLKKTKYAVDNEKVREYFPLPTVIRGTFEIYSKLFSVVFRPLTGYLLWHKDVELYGVYEPSGKVTGYFTLDLHPREGKYSHAAMFGVVSGKKSVWAEKDRQYRAPLACMVANFTKPTQNDPSLLGHDEVITFFHEFGHVMHQVLSTAKYSSAAGTAVARDFVEAPSQMFENWVWDKNMLKILSGHYQRASQKLPDELIQKMLEAKNHGKGYGATRQLVLALYDLKLHRDYKIKDMAKLYNDLVFKYLGLKLPKDAIFAAGFGHLCGYDAGYYGYMWSKVYAADLFTRFAKEGVMNQKTGTDYRQWILEKGSSQEELDLVRGFLGRDPNNEAFIKELNL